MKHFNKLKQQNIKILTNFANRMNTGKEVRQAYLLMHIAIFIWGFTGVLGRAITLSEAVLVWYRMGIAVLALYVWLSFNHKLRPLRPSDRQQVFTVGILLAIHWVLFYGAIKYSNISVTLCCLATSAFFTSLIEPFYNQKKINWTELACGILTLVGISFIFWEKSDFVLGIILGLSAAFIGGIFTVLSKKIARRYEPMVLNFYELLLGWLGLTFILPFYNILAPANHWFPNVQDWIFLILMGVVCTAIASSLALASLRHLSSFTMNLNINLEPVYGIVLAFIFFKENKELPVGFYPGASIVAFAVGLHTWISYQNGKKTTYVNTISGTDIIETDEEKQQETVQA